MSKLKSVAVDGNVIRQDKQGRYSLNDLHKAAMVAGVATESHAPSKFLRNDKVQDFIKAIEDQNNTPIPIGQNCPNLKNQQVTIAGNSPNHVNQQLKPVVSKRGGEDTGGGTWAVELVAIRYAAWINPHYEVKIYKTFQESAKYDKSFKFSRHQASVTYQVMSEMIQVSRELDGKEVCPHHFSNEALMINEAMFGVRAKIDRDKLLPKELDLIAFIEKKNTALIGRGLSYDERKIKIKEYADNWRIKYNLPLKDEDSVRLIEQQ